jgi:putative DNA primase/helicase
MNSQPLKGEAFKAANELVLNAMDLLREGEARKPGEEAFVALVSMPNPPKAGLWDYPLTDYGNAERLVLLFGQDLRYCHPWKTWLVWDGRRWVIDATAEVIRRAKATVRKMYAAAVKIDDSDRRDKALKHARATEKQSGLNAMIALAASEPGIPVLPEQLDADPLLLNLRNGTFDLKECKLREHRREDLITKICPVDYDPEAQCPTWKAFQRRVTGGNQELIEFKQRLVGYSLSGVVREKRALFIYYGPTNAGKTTETELLRDLMGDYAGQINIESLMEGRLRDGNAPSPDVASLRGKRLVISSEPREGARLEESKIKYLTGMGKVRARHLNKEFFEFQQTWKFFVDCNHKPVIRGTDNAIWNRVALVPWEARDPGNRNRQVHA